MPLSIGFIGGFSPEIHHLELALRIINLFSKRKVLKEIDKSTEILNLHKKKIPRINIYSTKSTGFDRYILNFATKISNSSTRIYAEDPTSCVNFSIRVDKVLRTFEIDSRKMSVSKKAKLTEIEEVVYYSSCLVALPEDRPGSRGEFALKIAKLYKKPHLNLKDVNTEKEIVKLEKKFNINADWRSSQLKKTKNLPS